LYLKQNALGNPNHITDFVMSTFSNARVLEIQGTLHRYELPSSDLSLAETFHQLQTNSKTLGIEYYSISQTTLEQIFLQLTKNQEEEEEKQKEEELIKQLAAKSKSKKCCSCCCSCCSSCCCSCCACC